MNLLYVAGTVLVMLTSFAAWLNGEVNGAVLATLEMQSTLLILLFIERSPKWP